MFKLWQGLKKKLNSNLSFGQAALTFFFSLGHFLLILVNDFVRE